MSDYTSNRNFNVKVLDFVQLVGLSGLEPETSALSGLRSNQLS